MEEDENGVVGGDRVHIVDLNDVSRPVRDIVLDAVIVDRHVDEMDCGVRRARDADGREDASRVKLAKPELEEEYRDAHFKNVWEKVEAEDGVEDRGFRYRLIENERNRRAERLEQSKVSYHLVPREDREGKYQRVERAEVEGKILERGIPRDEVVDDRGNSREGKNAENGDLKLLRTAFKNEVKRYVEQKGKNKTENVCGAKGTPSHD